MQHFFLQRPELCENAHSQQLILPGVIMDRREFLQNLAVTAASIETITGSAVEVVQERPSAAPNLDGHTLLCEFGHQGGRWKVYEDLRVREGAITFVSSSGAARVLPKTAEPSFRENRPYYLGLSLDDIGMSGPDLLADKLLAHGDDPDEELAKSAAPPQGAPAPNPNPQAAGGGGSRAQWDNYVGTKECYDTQPVFPGGNTKTYHPVQYVPELRQDVIAKRFDGHVGAWMPAPRKVYPLTDTSYCEVIVFGDPETKGRFIVQTWHRTAVIENGKMTKVFYGYTYPAYPPARQDPKPEEFYRGLLVFAEYWDGLLKDFAPLTLPDDSWTAISKHYFAKELMARPGGLYPKYGAVDRDYAGNEYDGFQDIFTSAVYVNLEWGRFEIARQFIDNYYTEYVDGKGVNDMRGPETAQFGLTLSLLARYFDYTRDSALLMKHRAKIEATAKVIADMHDLSLKLPADDPAHGLLAGWSESDACLAATPSVWWKPYYANTAFSVRGFRDLSRVWLEIHKLKPAPRMDVLAQDWARRSKMMRETMVASIEKNIWRDKTPPYVPPMPGAKLMFREALAAERPSPQQWPHRLYAELVHADVLPANLANMVCDTMRAYGSTTLGVLANVSVARAGNRSILGFIAYGYAYQLLRLDRIEEYLLFLYSHRYHDHTRGSWVAGEVSGITGGRSLFCVPAQQTIPIMVKWALVLDDPDEERIYFGKAVPRSWLASGKPVRITQAPTRWGRVNLDMVFNPGSKRVSATVELARAGSPKEIHVKLRMPKQTPIRTVTVNGRPAKLSGPHSDTVIISTGAEKRFEVIGELA
jgi:hypothetical protein